MGTVLSARVSDATTDPALTAEHTPKIAYAHRLGRARL